MKYVSLLTTITIIISCSNLLDFTKAKNKTIYTLLKGGNILDVQHGKILYKHDVLIENYGQFPIGTKSPIAKSEYRPIIRRDEIPEIIKKYSIHNVDWIKVYSDNLPFNTDNLFTLKWLKDIVFHAHNNNIKVASHAYTQKSIDISITAGIDNIEHGFNIKLRSIYKIKKKLQHT